VKPVGNLIVLIAAFLWTTAAWAQDTARTEEAPAVAEEAADGSADAAVDPASEEAAAETGAGSEADLLPPEDLQTLVAPVALYPDTVLIQVLVAATYPLDVVKADRYLSDHPDAAPGDLTDDIGQQGWDESVAVLASAFPDVLNDMAAHIDWTDTVGTAMLAQSDDVMAAVQVMRDQARDTGALQTTEEQTVEVTQDDGGGDTIVIQPADPQVVYVPRYDPDVVYVHDSFDAGDAIAAGLITWGTIAIIDDIFDDDDHWHGYWGCGNCGGWGGGPIIRDPDIDIDVDGDVNIGNRVDIDREAVGDRRDGGGWEPDPDRAQEAREKIADRQRPDGGTKLPVEKPDRGDQLRANLSRETGARDIAGGGGALAGGAAAGGAAAGALNRDGGGANRPQVNRPQVNRPASLPAQDRAAAVDRTKLPQAGNRSTAARPAVAGGNRAAAPKRPATAKAPARKSAGGGGALAKHSGGAKARAGGARGRQSAGGRRPRR
jgi:hypothetical protein